MVNELDTKADLENLRFEGMEYRLSPEESISLAAGNYIIRAQRRDISPKSWFQIDQESEGENVMKLAKTVKLCI